MKLLLYEWRKLFRLPILWIFLLLCWMLNGLLIVNDLSGRAFFNEASTVTADLGQRVDEPFIENLKHYPALDNRDVLLEAALGMENIFSAYETKELSVFYQNVVSSSPKAMAWMAWKYDLLQKRVDELALDGAAMDFYAGFVTHKSHQFLFDTLLRAAMAESAVLAMVAALYLLGHEALYQTTSWLSTTATGRRLWLVKCLAVLTAALLLYGLCIIPTLAGYLALWDYSGIWPSHVSSQFNYLTDMLYRRPFLTWGNFTVAGYLSAVLALGAVLTVVFGLMALVSGLLIENTYVAFLVLAVFGFGGLGITSVLASGGWWCLYFAALIHPVCIWLCVNGWFTELGLNAVLPWQETIMIIFNVLLWTAGTMWALHRFGRKDLMR